MTTSNPETGYRGLERLPYRASTGGSSPFQTVAGPAMARVEPVPHSAPPPKADAAGGESLLLYPSCNSGSSPFDACCLVWGGSGGREQVSDSLQLEATGTGMLACVVDCSQICRARSTSRRTGCEDKLRSAEKDCIRFPNSTGCSEGSCGAESLQCVDGAVEQSECITAPATNGNESDDGGLEKVAGSAQHRRKEKGSEEISHMNGEVTETDRDERPDDDALAERDESEQDVSLPADHVRSNLSRVSIKSSPPLPVISIAACSKIESDGLQSFEQTQAIRQFSDISQVGAELGPGSRFRFGDGAESSGNTQQGGEKGCESQLLERGSSSGHDFFGDELDVVESIRDDEGAGGVELGLAGSWGDNLRGTQYGEDTAECITNVGEEDGFGFAVEDFQTPGEQRHEESVQGTQQKDNRELHANKELQSQRGRQVRQKIGNSTFESKPVPQAQTESKALRPRAGSHKRPSKKEVEVILPQPIAASGGVPRNPNRLEAGPGRVGKSSRDAKEAEVEVHQLKIEIPLISEDRRVRQRLEVPHSGGSGRVEESTEEATKPVIRPRPSGGKDRHSKVNTAKGPRDRRVRLSVPTAVQFYDVQDRLGYDQPSKAVEWLIKKAKVAIDELGRLPGSERGNDVPLASSDATHSPPFSTTISCTVTGSSSCPPPGSFTGALSFPFGDIGSHMSYFNIDSSMPQDMPFGNLPGVQSMDVSGGGSLNFQQHLATAVQGQVFAGLGFPLGHSDLLRGNMACADGIQPGCEFLGSNLARLESRVKARERARERVKERGSGRDTVTGNCSSPSSMQSPPLHHSVIHSAYNIPNSMQGSMQGISMQSPQHSPHQSSYSVFNATLSGILQSPQQGTLQNLIMQNPSLQSPLTDHQAQGGEQLHSFHASLPGTLRRAQSVTSMQTDSGIQQQPHRRICSLEGSGEEGTLQVEVGSPRFTPGHGSSAFSDSLTSPFLQSGPLSKFGAGARGTHFSTGNPAVPIPAGFSPGPPASAFRSRQMPINQGHSHMDQQQLQGAHCQHIQVPAYRSAPTSNAASSSSKLTAPPHYTSSRMGSLHSISDISHDSPSYNTAFRNIDRVYEAYPHGLHNIMSPGRTSGSFPLTSPTQLQLPARIQGLADGFEDELASSSPPSPSVHP